MEPMKNRYAWTDFGPVTVMNGGNFTTAQVRRWLKAQGFTVNRWARNWSAFWGWFEVSLYMEAAR